MALRREHFRNPVIRSNENALSPTDVPNRLIVRGSIGLVGKWVSTPLYEWRTGFPWSAVDELQDFVGRRNESGRLPTVSTLDFSLARPWHFRKYHFSAGIKIYNAFDAGNERDVQNNITSPDYSDNRRLARRRQPGIVPVAGSFVRYLLDVQGGIGLVRQLFAGSTQTDPGAGPLEGGSRVWPDARRAGGRLARLPRRAALRDFCNRTEASSIFRT
jgi:hypothetical protein